MKKFTVLLTVTFAMAFFLITSFTGAQTIIVVLKQPPPNQWHVEDLWQLTLINTSQESYNVYLYGTVEEAGAGFVFEGITASFTLESNYSGPVYPGDLEPVDVGYVNSDYEDIVQKTGTLPAGTYTICIYVKNYETDEELGYDCITQYIMHPSPPELISPIEETIIEEELLVFMWMPPMPILPGDMITYNLIIMEIMDGQTAIEATEANPAWFGETGIFSTSFQFPISAREFEQGVTYAWQVTAVVENKNWVIGKSEVWWFTYYKEQPEGKPLIIKNISEGDTVGSVVVIEADVGERPDIVECSFYVRWDKEWLLIAKDSAFEDEWWTQVNTYTWVKSGNKNGELKVVAKTKKGKVLESEPIKIIVSN